MSDTDTWRERVRDAYARSGDRLWRAILGWSGSAEVADEAVAEAYAQLLRRGEEVRDPDAWAWRAAFRLAAGDLDRRRNRPDDAELAEAAGHLAVTDRLPDDAAVLVEALAALSDQQRRAVVLVDGAGHSPTDAAAILGTTAGAVRVQLHRARHRLRSLLADTDSQHGKN